MTVLQSGIATGRLVGGNLAVLASLVGTSVCPNFDGSILFLEEIGEPPYRIDRCLSQLQLSGALDSVAGVVLGHFTDCEPSCESKDDSPSLRFEQVLEHYFGGLGVPVVAGVPCGHESPNITLPLNAMVDLDADGLSLRVT